MDHRFRGHRAGLFIHSKTSERPSREEFQVIIDEYAAEAIQLYVPETLQRELAGWARSYYVLEYHINAIESYNKPKLPEPTDAAWNETKQRTLTKFRRLPKVSPISYKNFDSVKWIPSSSAGYGYSGHKGDPGVYERARVTAVTLSERLHHDPSYYREALEESTPDLAFTRTQLCQLKVKTKVRNVWGEAFHYVLLEGLFADPLIEMFKELSDFFYFIGKNPLLSVPALIDEMFTSLDYIYMFDWSGFDSSVQEWEIRFAFECLEQLLTFPSNVELLIWRFVTELFIYRKISSPHGVIYMKTMGIPSGSCFTNIVGSITNYVRIQYIFTRLTNRGATVYTHGDDSLAGVESTQYIPMERFDEICSPLLWSINLSKSAVSRQHQGVTFLSRTVRERQNARDEMTCLRMLMFPEHPVEDGSISTRRAYSIMTDAGINSHFLYKCFIYLKDKYGLSKELPFALKQWNLIEYEALKKSASELL